MKLFLDTNVLLDLVQDRAGVDDVRRIVGVGQEDEWTRLYVSFLSMANIAYVLRKKPMAEIKDCLSKLHKFCVVLPMNDSQFTTAVRNCSSPDFEDSLQIMCAEENGCDLILTHNVPHFRDFTDLPVLSPSDFLAKCNNTVD
jgi:predicted nucleic acid-binding protein